MENVLTAPHIGGATKEAAARSSVSCAEAIDDFFSGRTPKFVIPEMRDVIYCPEYKESYGKQRSIA